MSMWQTITHFFGSRCFKILTHLINILRISNNAILDVTLSPDMRFLAYDRILYDRPECDTRIQNLYLEQ